MRGFTTTGRAAMRGASKADAVAKSKPNTQRIGYRDPDLRLHAHTVYFVLALRLLWDGNRRRASRFAQMITSPGSAIIYVSRRIFSA